MSGAWPAFPADGAWLGTYPVLHMWSQVVGKVKTALCPPENHWWHTTMHVTPRGLTTGPIPGGPKTFQLELDFRDHRMIGTCHDGGTGAFALDPELSVAGFHGATMDLLAELGVHAPIWPVPVEVPEPVPFADDHRTGYDRGAVERWWQATLNVDRVMRTFRGEFLGKSSPVHFFWGAFDLAVTRFSGRSAPEHPGGVPGVGDWVMHEAYSHEVSSAGFWPGAPDGSIGPSLYAYAYPEPDGYRDAPVPAGTTYDEALGEYLLPYDVVRQADDPDELALSFLRATYAAAARNGHWDPSLERTAFPSR